MAEEIEEVDAKASLARLRLFLAPHTPPAIAPHPDVDGRPSKDAGGDESMTDAGDDLSGDLAAFADQLSAAADEEDREERQGREDCESQAVTAAIRVVNGPASPVTLEGSAAVVSTEEDEVAAKQHTVPAVGAVATVSPLDVQSKEFIRVKYLLQCSLPGFRVHDEVLLWDMKNPGLVEQYEARANGLLELDSWIEVDNLSAAMGEMHSYGFTQVADEHNAMKFTTGAISLDPRTNKKGRKQLVLCKIAVGRSLVVRSEEDAKSKELPPGYHSYYVCRHDANTSAAELEATESTTGYSHEYILMDALQILPQFLVRFSYSALDTTASHACALCEKQPATLVCKTCDAELCSKCDEEVHSANKLVERHKRVPRRERIESSADSTNGRTRRRSSTPVSATTSGTTANGDSNPTLSPSGVCCEQQQPAMLAEEEVDDIVTKQLEDTMADFQATCRLHDGKKVEFYCPVCALPVCVNCKMVGDHSIGEKGAHRLLSIRDAYERSLRESFKRDPLVDARKTVIDNKLAFIAQWKQAVDRNREQVHALIQQQYESALQRLQDEARKKIGVLDGETLEFKRQLQQIEWLEDCLDEQRASCSVIDFLSTWNQHKVLRAEQRNFPPGSLSSSSGGEHVKADLQLTGSLQVVHGDQFEPRRSITSGDDEDVLHQHGELHGPVSPRCTTGDQSIRHASDSDIRRKLLSMRGVEPTRLPSSSPCATPRKHIHSAMTTTLSSQGMKMMEEIRNDLLSRGTIRSSAYGANNTISSRGLSPQGSNNPTATLRTFSLQPPRPPSRKTSGNNTMNESAKQRTGTAAWAALFHHELALAKDLPRGSPEQQ